MHVHVIFHNMHTFMTKLKNIQLVLCIINKMEKCVSDKTEVLFY